MTLPAPVPELPPALVDGARVLPYRSALLPLLPRGGVFVEVGVGLGDWSRTILDTLAPSRFVGIDTFELHTLPTLWGRPGADWFGARTHAQFYRDRFAPEAAAGVVDVLEGDSAAQLRTLADESADVIYLDADHTYPSIRAELDIARRKVKPDGWIVVNDYILVDELHASQPYGVIYATHEFMIQHGWAMRYLALQTNMYCDVALQRAGGEYWPPVPPVRVDQASLYSLAAPADPQMAALAEANAVLRHEVAVLRASTSWRVTAPLRALGALLGRRA